MKINISRTVVMTAALAVAAGGLLAFAGSAAATNPPASASTFIGTAQLPASANGKLQFSATSGSESTAVTWSTNTAIGASAQSAELQVETTASPAVEQITNSITAPQANSQLSFGSPITTQGGFTGGTLVDSILGAASNADTAAISSTGATFEVFVSSGDASSNYTPVFDAFVTIFPDFSFQISSSNPVVGRPAATVAVQPITSVPSGSPVTVNVAIDATAVGTLSIFADGSTTALATKTITDPSGPVAFTINTGAGAAAPNLADGSHTITASFTPGSGSPASGVGAGADTTGASVSIQGATSENITVNVQADEGTFSYTVGSGTVNLLPKTGTGYDSKGHAGSFGSGTFNYTGAINPVTVHDYRQQSKPGWYVNGVVSDFTGPAGATIDGKDLGWTPSVTSQTSGVTAGSAITPVTPGLKGTGPGGIVHGNSSSAVSGGGDLADAVVGGGQNDTVLGAGLTLVAPDTTKPGTYNATLTFTAFDAAR